MDDPERQLPWGEAVAAPLPEDAPFTPQERWAWARIIRGERADLRYFPKDDAAAQAAGANGADDGAGNDPKAAEKWPAHRDLSALFLRTILFHQPWASARARPFVRIACARFGEALNWENESFAGEIELSRSLFMQDLVWRGLTVGKLLDLQGSRLDGALQADRLAVGGSLFCRGGFSAKQEIRLVGARIRGNVDFTGATLAGALEASGLAAEGDLFCRDGFSAEQKIRLLGARVSGNVEFNGATLDGALHADGLAVEANCFLREMKLGDARLIAAHIGGHFQLCASAIEGQVDLTGAEIKGELNLARHKGDEPRWGDAARLVLRNAKAGAMAGGLDAFRRGRGFVPCELDGFAYERLGGVGAGDETGSTLARAPSKQLRRWLKACCPPSKGFEPGPFRTLAHALSEAGHPGKASDIRNELGNHELAAHGVAFSRKLVLALSSLLIGYGERNHRAMMLFLALVLGAAAVGYWQELIWLPAGAPSSWGDLQAWLDWGGFAFAGAVPLITFDEAHKAFLIDRFAPHGVPVGLTGFFYAVKVAGFVILSYLAAGLSGLAQRGARTP